MPFLPKVNGYIITGYKTTESGSSENPVPGIGQPVYNEDTLMYEFDVDKSALVSYNVWVFAKLYDYPAITRWSSNDVDIEITCGSEKVYWVTTAITQICLGGSTADLPVQCGDAWTAQLAPAAATSYTHSLANYFTTDQVLCPLETLETYEEFALTTPYNDPAKIQLLLNTDMVNVNVAVGRGVGFRETIYLKGISKPGYVEATGSWAGQFSGRPFTVIVCGAEVLDSVTDLVVSKYLFFST